MTLAHDKPAPSVATPGGRRWGVERRHPAPPVAGGGGSGGDRPRLAEGVELVGEYEGSGYVEPHYLARRGATGVVQLTELLHLVAEQCDGNKDHAAIAEAVSSSYGKTVSAENVATLVDDKLRPLGVVAGRDGSSPEVETNDPLLGLKFKTTLLGPRAVNAIVTPLTPLFWWPIVAVVCVALAGFDFWLFFSHGLAQGLRKAVEQPIVFLIVGALVVVSAAMHELGHAGALKASGGKPGRMGAGLYLAWPAFYTDVTDAYSLPRRGRLRTDLGGVYFNAITVLACAGVYYATRFEPLLLICFVLQIQVLQQLLPLLRLDGYYVLADLLGVPDLFRRTGPVLKSMLPGHEADQSVKELTPRARRIITGWTLAVVPLLLANLLYIVVNAPRILATAWDSAARQVGTIQGDTGAARAVAVLQLVILLIPIIGISITVARVAARGGQAAWGWSEGSPRRRVAVGFSAAALMGALAYSWWPDGTYSPYRPGETGTVAAGIADIGTAGSGTPELRSPREAQQPLPPRQEEPATTTDSGTTTSDTGGAAPAATQSASTQQSGAPDPSSSPAAAEPTASAQPSSEPTPTATPTP